MEFMRKTELPFNWIKGFCKLNSFIVASLFISMSQNTAAETLTGVDVPILAQSQKGAVIKGTVVDERGEAVIGANVTVKSDPKVGVITDMDGNFTIDVPVGTVLQISYIGYTPQDIVAKSGAPIKVKMVEDTQTLSEVVVVGYGSMDKKELTSAVVSVKSKDFLQGAANNAMQMIDGKVPGVTLSGYGASDPSRDPMSSLQVRGAGSLDAGNGPLIVIDGMPGGDLRNVANQDIESITVLKDGSAAAIYGSRAANGVVIVQTKKGGNGKVSITYDGYIEHDFIANKPDLLSADEFLEHGIDKDWGARTDWYDELIRKNNFGQNHYLALSGGCENTQFRVSTNYKKKDAIDIATAREEYGIRAGFQQKTLEGLLEVGGNISYRITNDNYLRMNDDYSNSYGAFSQAVKLNPTIPVMDPDDPTRYNILKGYDTYNPIGDIMDCINDAKNEFSVIDFNIKLNILPNLNTELKLARQSRNANAQQYYNKYHRDSFDNMRSGRARLKSENWTDWTLEWIGNWFATFGKNNVKVMGGYSYQEFNNQGFWAENMNFPSDAPLYNNLETGSWLKLGKAGMDSWKSKEKAIAFLGRVNYSYDDTYLASASLRYEGNSKFGKDNKWGFFPAASAAWRFSNLDALKSISAINDLKLRASYGVTGRSGFPRYKAQAIYKGFGRYQNDMGEWIQVYGPDNNPNFNLKWEKQISWNFGVDYALFDNRLSGSLDYFIRDGRDVISDYDAPVPPFLHQNLYTNVATTRSNGVELNVQWQAVKTKDFSYETNVTASYTQSKLVKFSNGTFTKGYMDRYNLPSPGNPGPAQRLQDGVEIGSFYGTRYAGVDESGNLLIWKEAVVGGETKLAKDKNDKDKAFIGTGMPKWDLSWGHTFTYKEFDLSLFFRGKFDYEILNLYQMYYGLQAQPNVNLLKDAFERNGHIKSEKEMCDYFLENGNYFKLDNITVGWNPKLDTKWISNLRVYATLKNVFTMTKYSGLDPANIQSTGLEPGIGRLDVYPSARSFSFGLQITY